MDDRQHIGQFGNNNPGRGNDRRGRRFAEQNRMTAGGLSRFTIRDAVADHEAAGEIEIEFASGPEQHSWFRLSAVASIIGGVGADVGGIDGSALLGQKFGKPIGYPRGLAVSEQAPANPRLVGDHDEPKALFSKLLENRRGVRQQHHMIGRRNVAVVVHKYAVTVEKYSAMAHNIECRMKNEEPLFVGRAPWPAADALVGPAEDRRTALATQIAHHKK